jgi:mono/diheme cytochrome c family protein
VLRLLAIVVLLPVACAAPSGDADAPGSSGAETTGGSTEAASGSESESSGSDSSGGSAADVTYHRDIRPLVERHCSACHTPGNIAPFPLTSYDEVFAMRETIAVVVDAGTMPPWGMTSECAEIVGDPLVSPDDRERLQAWVDAGGPEGDPNEYVAPEPITLPELTRTDLVLELDAPYEPQLMPDEYRCFLFEWPHAQTKFVTGFQFEPGNAAIAHHAIAYIIAPADVPDYDARDAQDEGPGYGCFGGPGGSEPLDFIASRWLGAWAPGSRVGDLPEGTGLRIDPGSKIVLQMHYNTLASDGNPDRSRMLYRLADAVEREAFMLPWADPSWLAGDMPIPAGSADTVHAFALDPTSVIDVLTNGLIPGDTPLEFFTAMHHMHKRGSRGFHEIIRPGGERECLLDVPTYDFDWQQQYRYAQSKILRPGDQLHVECQWDNTDNAVPLNWGDGTEDEMCLGVYYITPAP